MLAKGWIEREPGLEYRITEAGIDATKLKDSDWEGRLKEREMPTYETQKRWTQHDGDLLRELAKSGKSAKEICEAIGRTLAAVRHDSSPTAVGCDRTVKPTVNRRNC